MSDVYLAVYDLSHGMARNLSSQFLGPDHVIDMIPHTGLLVFGKEYFFGSGIQAVSNFPAFSGLQPLQCLCLGRTNTSQEDFDRWCQTQTQFSQHTYDLLHRNCNHFCDVAAKQALHLSQGVPEWILQVPQRFLASPMGQLVRPILEQMQITQHQQMLSSPAPPATHFTTTATPTTTATSSNPWANLPKVKSPVSETENPSTSPLTRPRSVSPTPPSDRSLGEEDTSDDLNYPSILQRYTKPMISNDCQSLQLCAKKLLPYFSNDTSRKALLELVESISTRDPEHPKGPCRDETRIDPVVPELWRLIQEGHPVVPFALLILRIVVLHFAKTTPVEDCMRQLMRALDDQSKVGIEDGHAVLDHNQHHSDLVIQDPSTLLVFPTPVARSLAWCVVSNYTSTYHQEEKNYATSTKAQRISPIPTKMVEAAIRDWNHEDTQVRQAACTFLYNYVITHAASLEHDEETMVSLICSSLESLVEEQDPTTRLRRLLVGSRVVFGVHRRPTSKNTNMTTRLSPTAQQEWRKDIQIVEANEEETDGRGRTILPRYYNEMAKDLVQDLGFVSLLQELTNATMTSDASILERDEKICQKLALQLIRTLQ